MRNSSQHPLLTAPGAIAIAHRGGAEENEENTLPAFRHALALGYTHVELDVHATRDNVVVIHHDPDLMRLCENPKRIADLDYEELRDIRTKGGNEILTLERLLQAYPELYVTIEAKSRAVIKPLCDLIARMGVLERVCIGSFDPLCTQAAVEHLGERLLWSPAHAQVARLWARGWGLPLRLACFGVVQIPAHWKGIPVVTPRLIKAASEVGIAVQVWTVNEAAEMNRLLDMGVSGLMTDRPTLLRKILMNRGAWPSRGED